ncbi:carbonyl reductase [NADPH] 1-like [Salvelinus namaycush]|uniref:carbonyl reductase (NADPH) n=1 Tax=Salvelinus namaycush TaxID=8040 RepID=A0A8U1ESC9_SALNM|nr:carbonyl reductase [NADPH] 1-like [Salvelinus namaycush]
MSGPQVVLVTGSTRGLGLAIVQALCQGFKGDVYLSARDVQRGAIVVEHLQREGLKPRLLQLDITDPVSIQAARQHFMKEYGGLDVLINNAGIAPKRGDPASFGSQAERILQTNFFATRDMCNEFLPLLKKDGRIVNVASIVGYITLYMCSPDLQARLCSDDITEEELVALMKRFVAEAKAGDHINKGWPNSVYGVSKIGLMALTRIQARSLRREMPQRGILINSCCPGWVKSDMTYPNGTKTPAEGADTPVYLALFPPATQEPQGEFVVDRQVQVWAGSPTGATMDEGP